MTTTPDIGPGALTAGLALVALVWSIIGYLSYAAVRDVVPRGVWLLYVVAIAGPLTWALAGYAEMSRLRRAILRRFGVASYSCCGGTHGAHDPHPNGTSSGGHHCPRHGYPGDDLQNHPATR